MLQKQSVDIEFSSGPDRKSDEFTVIPTKVTVLENGQFVDKTTLEARGGFAQPVQNNVYSGSAPSAFRRLVQRGQEVALESATGFHVADLTGQLWRQVAPTLNRCCAELDSVAHPPGDVLESDQARSVNGLTCLVWTDVGSNGGGFVSQVYMQLRRGETVVAQQALTSAESCCPRVVYLNSTDNFYIYWIENQSGTGKVLGMVVNASNPSIGSGTVIENTFIVVGTSGSTTGIPMIAYMDVVANPFKTVNNIFLVHRSVTAPTVGGFRGLLLDSADGTTVHSSGGIGSGALGDVVTGITALVADETGYGLPGNAIYNAIVKTATAALGVLQYVTDDTSGMAGFFVGASGGNPTGRITSIVDPADGKKLWIAWDEGSAGTTTSRVVTGRAGTFGGSFLTGPSTVARSIGLASGIFQLSSSSLYLGVNLFSTVQPTFYAIQIVSSGAVVTAQHDICARIGLLDAPIKNRYQLRGVPRVVVSPVPTIPILRASQDFVTIGTAVPVNNVTDVNRTPIGLDLLTLDFSAQLNSVEVDRAVVLAGANPQFFDGMSLVELGFEHFPETPTASAGSSGGGTSTGTYSVTCLYEWIDRYGVVHQSAPANPVSVSVTAGQRITVTVPTLRLTKKTNVRIIVYRTAANGTTYYRIQDDTLYSNAVLNNPSVDTITLAADGMADTTVEQGEFLPTTGGALANEVYPSCKFIAPHQERLIFSGLVDRELVQYTEERQGVFFPGTNGVYLLEVNTEAGRCSATVSMDDKLIIAQENALGVYMGRGPNRLGLDNSLSNYIRVENGYGHSWAESNTILQDTDGIWFRDSKGLRQLNRSLQISRMQVSQVKTIALGAEVDDLIDTTVGAAVVLSKKQIVFANKTSMLVWDYENRQWSQFTSSLGYSFQDPVELNSKLTFISRDTDQLLDEVPTNPTDLTDTAIQMRWVTAWIKLAGLQGFQRAYRATVLAKYLGTTIPVTFTAQDRPMINVSTIYVVEPTNQGIMAGDSVNIGSDYYTVLAIGDFSDADHSFITIDGTVTMLVDETFLVYRAVSTTNLEVGFDFDESWPELAEWTQEMDDRSSTTAPMQFQHHLIKQKCESVRFRITHRAVGGLTRFTGMTIVLGGKGGMFKLASGKRV